MNTLNKYELASILNYLQDAEHHAARMLHLDGPEAREVWLGAVRDDLKCARDRLLNAGLTDIAIEPPAVTRKMVPSVPASQTDVVS